MLISIVHRKAGGVTASDLMASPAVTVAPEDTVEHAARLMYTRRVKQLPVVEEAGQLVGIVSRTDVLAVLTARMRRSGSKLPGIRDLL